MMAQDKMAQTTIAPDAAWVQFPAYLALPAVLAAHPGAERVPDSGFSRHRGCLAGWEVGTPPARLYARPGFGAAWMIVRTCVRIVRRRPDGTPMSLHRFVGQPSPRLSPRRRQPPVARTASLSARRGPPLTCHLRHRAPVGLVVHGDSGFADQFLDLTGEVRTPSARWSGQSLAATIPNGPQPGQVSSRCVNASGRRCTRLPPQC